MPSNRPSSLTTHSRHTYHHTLILYTSEYTARLHWSNYVTFQFLGLLQILCHVHYTSYPDRISLLPVTKVKGKGKCHTLDLALFSEGTSLQKRSGMARVVEGFHSFTCILTRLSTNGINHTCLCLSSQSWYY